MREREVMSGKRESPQGHVSFKDIVAMNGQWDSDKYLFSVYSSLFPDFETLSK